MRQRSTGRVEGKVALVTGGAGSIGAAIAERLVQEGAKVVITDMQEELGKQTAAELGCDFVRHDVTNEQQWMDIVQDIETRHGALHIVVNNAGITTDVPNSNTEHALLSEWQKTQRVNVEGVFLGCKVTIPVLRRAGGGSIINMSSIAAMLSNPDNPAYGASKAAVWHLTKSTAVYCARNGSNIRCNSVHPGLVETPMMQKTVQRKAKSENISFEEAMKGYGSIVPTGRLLQPEDIANAVLFLASDEAKQITGAGLVVDGGHTAQ